MTSKGMKWHACIHSPSYRGGRSQVPDGKRQWNSVGCKVQYWPFLYVCLVNSVSFLGRKRSVSAVNIAEYYFFSFFFTRPNHPGVHVCYGSLQLMVPRNRIYEHFYSSGTGDFRETILFVLLDLRNHFHFLFLFCRLSALYSISSLSAHHYFFSSNVRISVR